MSLYEKIHRRFEKKRKRQKKLKNAEWGDEERRLGRKNWKVADVCRCAQVGSFLRFDQMKCNLFANQGLEISNLGTTPHYARTFVAKNTEEQHSQIDHLVQVPGQNAGQNAGQISAEDQGDLQNLHTST